MTEQTLDQLIQRVMLDAARREYGGLPEEPHMFSPIFERKMKKLLRRGNHPLRHQILHAAACLLLVLILSGCAVLAVSPEAREVFAGWVREVHETYFLYHFFEEYEDEETAPLPEEDAVYQPAYVPSGYRMEFRSILSGIVSIAYINDQNGNRLAFRCFTDSSSPVLQIERNSGVTDKKVLVNGISADLYLDGEEGEANVLVWVDEGRRLAFRISGVFGEEELLKVAESVRAVPRNGFFRPAWLPKGYYEASVEDCPVNEENIPNGLDAGKSVLSYENGKGGQLTVTYAHKFEITDLRPDRSGADGVSVWVGEDPAFLFLDQEAANHLVWVDGSSGVFFWISGPFDGGELIQIAESLEAYEEPPPLEERRLTWVPAGYQELDHVMMRDQGHVQYQNDEGNIITLSYCRGTEAVNLYVIPAGDGELIPQPVLVGDLPADLYLEEGEASILVWAEGGLLFSILAYCPAEEMIAMAESVEVLPVEYRPAWVPEGYELYMQDETFGSTAMFFYKNPEGDMMAFAYQPDWEDAKVYLIPDEGGMEKRMSVKGNPADLYLVKTGGTQSELVWQDPEAGALFSISASLPEEDILKMAESIKAVRPSPKIRRPNWLPMGYRYAGGSAGSGKMESRYKNGEGDKILFTFLGPSEAEKQNELREAVQVLESQSVLVNGQTAELYSAAEGIRCLVWSGREPGEIYRLSAALDTGTLIQVAESVFYPP